MKFSSFWLIQMRIRIVKGGPLHFVLRTLFLGFKMIEQSYFFLIHQLEKQMQYLYNYPQFVDDLGQISQELKNELIKFLGKQSVLNLVLQQQQQLLQKMNVLNNYLISNETQSTIQESKNDSMVIIYQGEEKINDKNLIRKECLLRYRAKKRMWMNRTLYECRKQIADRRLRFNGQFLNCEEEKKIIKIHKILGNHYVRIKNNTVFLVLFYKLILLKEQKVKTYLLQHKNKWHKKNKTFKQRINIVKD